jgi:Ca2+-binding RTX toxin-like protein
MSGEPMAGHGRFVRAALGVVAGLIATLGPAAAADATFPIGGNGKILYAAQDGGDTDVFTMNVDGSSKTNLTSARTDSDFQPAFSPDGTKIVFSSTGGIWIMNADGSGAVPLDTPLPASEELPAFSPDGKKIAYTDRSVGGNGDVFVMNADGSSKVDLTIENSTGEDQQPSYSPDGTRIAYQECDPNCHIAAMNPDGSGKVDLTLGDPARFDGGPYYSPDGTQLAFVRCDVPRTRCDAAVMPAGGGNATVITGALAGVMNVHPGWSPDGKLVAISSGTGSFSQQDIVVINADGSNPVNLTASGTESGAQPDWESVYTCRGRRAGIVGTLGADTLLGTNASEVFFAFDGRDQVNAGGGKDIVCGGNGGGKFVGAAGKDTLVGGTGNDKEFGGKGKDLLIGKKGKDLLNGGKGADKCKGGAGKDKDRNCEKGKS